MLLRIKNLFVGAGIARPFFAALSVPTDWADAIYIGIIFFRLYLILVPTMRASNARPYE